MAERAIKIPALPTTTDAAAFGESSFQSIAANDADVPTGADDVPVGVPLVDMGEPHNLQAGERLADEIVALGHMPIVAYWLKGFKRDHRLLAWP